MTHSALYLSFPNHAPLAVKVQLTDDGLLVQAIGRPEVRFIIGGLTALQSAIQPRVERRHYDPRTLSPVEVVRYFQQSPILQIYADDVRTAVLSHSEALQGDLQLEQDLRAVQGLSGASQADIAERLFGDRTKTGGSYRRRILAVMDATTTPKSNDVIATPSRKAA